MVSIGKAFMAAALSWMVLASSTLAAPTARELSEAIRRRDAQGAHAMIAAGAPVNPEFDPAAVEAEVARLEMEKAKERGREIDEERRPAPRGPLARDIPLHAAAWSDSEQFVETLLRAGASVNRQDSDGQTALMVADDIEVIRMLLAAGADVNAAGARGETALMRARDPSVFRALVEAGADVNARDEDGRDAMDHLLGISGLGVEEEREGEAEELVRLLIERGATLDRRDKRGEGRVGRAASDANLSAVRALLAVGAPVSRSADGKTPLHLAAERPAFTDEDAAAHDEILGLLAERLGIDVRDADGETALHSAAAMAMRGRRTCVPRLLALNASVDARSKDGDTPLIIAAGNGVKEAVVALLAAGADPTARSRVGTTPVETARFHAGFLERTRDKQPSDEDERELAEAKEILSLLEEAARLKKSGTAR